MSNPFGGFTPGPPEPEITPEVIIDGEFEEVKPAPTPPSPPPPLADPDTVLEVEAVLDEEVVEYRQQLGLISPLTLSRILGIHQDTLKGWRGEGRGPDYLKIGKKVWYHYAAVLSWLPTLSVKQKGNKHDTEKGLQENAQQRERASPDHPERAAEGEAPGEKPGATSD